MRKTLINKGFSLLIEYAFQNIHNYVDMFQIRLSCIFEMKKARFLAMPQSVLFDKTYYFLINQA
ncbi:hypothetical protein BK704_01605 [[Bacillus thuringiensis] serovar konkukian]|nr:hypothetical protein BK704_01605 [[Bacillus thuringiensis] serovar konkukian]